MNNAFLIVLGVFCSFGVSWYAVVKQAYVQLADQQEVKIVGSEQRYPAPKSGLAKQGAEVYRQEGCYYCHSQRVRATGYAFNLYIEKLPEAIPATPESETLTNEVVKAILKINPKISPSDALKAIRRAPQRIHAGLDENRVVEARRMFARLGVANALGIEALPTGPDITARVGVRPNAPVDYLHDSIVMPGSVRIGPDLTNVGNRKPLDRWHLLHLYSPSAMNQDSKMPSYPFLFEQKTEGHYPNPHSLRGGATLGVELGKELIPSLQARALAAYLASLRIEANLFEARAPQPETEQGGEGEGGGQP